MLHFPAVFDASNRKKNFAVSPPKVVKWAGTKENYVLAHVVSALW